MIRYFFKSILFLLVLFFTFTSLAQDIVKGVVKESTSNLPIESVLVSIAGESANTDANGKFEVKVTDPNSYLVVQIPGYTTRVLEINGRSEINVFMVKDKYKSVDDQVSTPFGKIAARDLNKAGSYIVSRDINYKANSSLDQAIQGKLKGANITIGSGMPGSRGFFNMRGYSSLYGRTEPLVVIDEMIHPIHYGTLSGIDGFSMNPLDLVDVEDISSISAFSDGISQLGSYGSNGVINIDTDQKTEASSKIIFNGYSGIAYAPKRQNLLDAEGFKSLFNQQLANSGLSQEAIDKQYSFLKASEGTEEYYRYNNNTNWQDEIYRLGVVQKYHLFLKGGDNIATYNISTGYLNHEGVINNTSYNRFNVRINGNINISDRFSVAPVTKLSLSDSHLMEQGPNVATNPILAAQLKSPLMAPKRKDDTGKEIDFIDDIGAFNVSNPHAIVENINALNRSYNFATSIKGVYKVNKFLNLSTFVGVDFNNSRDNIFKPSLGLTNIDSAYNTIRVMVNEYRSTQNVNQLNYSRIFDSNNTLDVKIGHRYMNNSYEYDRGTDLNTSSDEFQTLGQGQNIYSIYRTLIGEKRVIKWVSYFATADYSYASKYYLSAALSYDGTSVINKNSRYNFYPSVNAAWRLSSEPFMANNSFVDDLKLRVSFGQTGNMNNNAYDYSHMYYQGMKLVDVSVLTRVGIPNPNMEIEKQTTLNFGIDAALMSQKLNVSLDVFNSSVNNMIIQQRLAPAYGYTEYYDNSGAVSNMGAEVSIDYHQDFGKLSWNIGGSASMINNKVTSLDFLLNGVDRIVNKIEGASLVTIEGSPLYSFYGYKTNGIFNDDAEAAQYVGPNGQRGKAGDIRFEEVTVDGVIDEKDMQVIGSPIAPIYGGFYTSFEYGNFTLMTDFAFSVGNDVYNHVNKLGQSMEFGYNQQAVVKDRWTSENKNATIPALSVGDKYGNNVFSDRWLENGSFARMKTLTLSYKYPSSNKVFESLTVYVTATNLLTLTSYSGLDPESMLSNNPLYMSSDYGKIPQPRSFVIGVKLGL